MDARSLLRAKKAEARIDHPYAAYNASGVLRCSICAVPVKQWDAHLLTKQHRTSVAREKAEAQAAQAAAAKKSSKRAAPDQPSVEFHPQGNGAKRSKIDGEPSSSGGGKKSTLPDGFFSSGKAPTFEDEDDEDDEEEQDAAAGSSRTIPAPPVVAPPAPRTGDAELDDFLASLNDPEDSNTQPQTTNYAITSSTTTKNKRKINFGNLPPGQASYEAAPVRNIPAGEEEEAEEAEPEESEAERKTRMEREEREEIMGRLEEEERAQEDADSRVTMLKQRMEMLKKRREGRSAGAGTTAKSKKESTAVGTNGD